MNAGLHDRVFGGRYRATSLLKTGVGVETFLGSDEADQTAVVIKATPGASISASAQMRLEHEALVLRDLRSPWITPLLELGREGELLYLVVPYVEGDTRAARLRHKP